MAVLNVATADGFAHGDHQPDILLDSTVENRGQVQGGAVSWGAIVAGAAAAAALSLILLMLGVGLGLSSVSPWVNEGASAKAIGVSSILWITLTQIIAAGMGGSLAGRLRTKWTAVHSDEVHFRDTAHGFLAWAVASVATAALLTSAIGSIVNGGAQALAGGAATVASSAAAGGAAAGSGMTGSGIQSGTTNYFVDFLFRKDRSASPAAPPTGIAASAPTETAQQPAMSSAAEVARIFANSLRAGALPAEDARYVGQVVAQHTGLTQQDAEKRVNETYARAQAKLRDAETAARDAADQARKASAHATLWLFISLLIGAFVASLAATFGGRQRDA